MTRDPSGVRAFEALADAHRRQLLFALVEVNPEDDAGLDPTDLLDEGETDDWSGTQTGLAHIHLPKLEDLGFIEWDQETGEISKGPDWDQIAPLLRLMRDHRDELPENWLPDWIADEESSVDE